MAWDGAGNFTRTDGVRTGAQTWQEAAAAAIGIESDDHDVHDQDLADGIKNCLTIDGQNVMAADLDMDSHIITGLNSGTQRDHAVAVRQLSDGGLIWAGTSGGTANAQTLSLTPAVGAYVAGMKIRFIAGAANTDAATLNVNSVGAVALKYPDGAALVDGSLKAGSVYEAIYDGTAFRVNAERVIIRAVIATTSGTSKAITGIPTNAQRIIITLNQVSLNGTDNLLLRLGDAGGVESSGYTSHVTTLTTGGVAVATDLGSMQVVIGATAAGILQGSIVLELENAATFQWAGYSHVTVGNAASNIATMRKATSAALTQLQLLTASAAAFDAGNCLVRIEI